jgi:hypothetical protein
MRRFWVKYTAEIILLVYLILFLGLKKPYESWDRVINSDGKAYYGYLTAIFIYHDFDYNFIEDYEQKYYPADGSAFKEFRSDFRGETVNKGFPGLAALWLPFFLLAHLLTLLFGLPPDGYSIIYQYSIGFATLFYLWLGIKLLIKLLERSGAKQEMASFIAVIIALGTNMVYYAIVEPSIAHIYSFTLLTGFILSAYLAFEERKVKWYIWMTISFFLLVIIRPTNGIFILLLPFIAGSIKEFGNQVRYFFSDPKTIFYTLLFAIAILLIPPILWYLQSGYFFVYSYGQEGFDFTNPKVFKILFSYNRGWFVYTPVAFVAMAGFSRLLRINKFQGILLLILLVFHFYITSSWWVWHYTSKFSQRVFIDMYAIVALLLLYLFLDLKPNRLWSRSLKILLIALTVFNFFQFYQQYRWVYPLGEITKEMYWNSFGSLTRKAEVNIPDSMVVEKRSFFHDFEISRGWINEDAMTIKERNGVSAVNAENEYSVEFIQPLKGLFTGEHQLIRIEADLLTTQRRSDAALVIEFQTFGKTYSYNPIYLDPYNRKNNWVHAAFAIEPPEEMLTASDQVKIMFYNKSETSTLFVDNWEIVFYTLSAGTDTLENVIQPVIQYQRVSRVENNFESDMGWANSHTLTNEKSFSGEFSSKIHANQPFSPAFEAILQDCTQNIANLMILHAMVFCDDTVTATRFIADFLENGQSKSYHPFYISDRVKNKEWSTVEYILEIPEMENKNTRLKVYLWNPSEKETVFVDDLRIDFIALNNNEE